MPTIECKHILDKKWKDDVQCNQDTLQYNVVWLLSKWRHFTCQNTDKSRYFGNCVGIFDRTNINGNRRNYEVKWSEMNREDIC